jgi:hypothetical protein
MKKKIYSLTYQVKQNKTLFRKNLTLVSVSKKSQARKNERR